MPTEVAALACVTKTIRISKKIKKMQKFLNIFSLKIKSPVCCIWGGDGVCTCEKENTAVSTASVPVIKLEDSTTICWQHTNL